jgi:hypothetical protein
MTNIDGHGRPEPPIAADEIASIIGFLDYQRATLEWKSRGVDAAGLTKKVAPSTMTLGGILKHLAWVEDHWFSYFLHNRERCEPWDSVDWTADQNWEWNSAANDTPEQLRTIWAGAVDSSRANVESALSRGGIDQLATQRSRRLLARVCRRRYWRVVAEVSEGG